jgi:phage terminase small subunit
VNSGYSENTSRKGALLHVPKIQQYLKEAMNRRSQRLEITHDMILRELSKIAFSNMGNYYDEYACLKRMSDLTVDEKAAISYYDFVEIQDAEGYRVGTQSRIKLHNKMSALDKIARHLNFYGTIGKSPKSESPEVRKMEESPTSESREDGLLVITPTKAAGGRRESGVESLESEAAVAVVDRSTNNLPMDYPVEDFELEGIELKTLMVLEGVDVSPGRFSPESGVESLESEMVGGLEIGESMENILTISPLVGRSRESRVESLESEVSDSGLGAQDLRLKNALGMGADTGPVAKACAV